MNNVIIYKLNGGIVELCYREHLCPGLSFFFVVHRFIAQLKISIHAKRNGLDYTILFNSGCDCSVSVHVSDKYCSNCYVDKSVFTNLRHKIQSSLRLKILC